MYYQKCLYYLFLCKHLRYHQNNNLHHTKHLCFVFHYLRINCNLELNLHRHKKCVLQGLIYTFIFPNPVILRYVLLISQLYTYTQTFTFQAKISEPIICNRFIYIRWTNAPCILWTVECFLIVTSFLAHDAAFLPLSFFIFTVASCCTFKI